MGNGEITSLELPTQRVWRAVPLSIPDLFCRVLIPLFQTPYLFLGTTSLTKIAFVRVTVGTPPRGAHYGDPHVNRPFHPDGYHRNPDNHATAVAANDGEKLT